MTASSNGKKKFAVITIFDEKGPANIHAVLSEDHDAAYHQMEISSGEGAFIVLNKKQAQKACEQLKHHLQNW